MVRNDSKRKNNNMKKLIFLILIYFLSLNNGLTTNESIYDKIDLFGEVLEKINKEYVDEVDQSKTMDAAINGVLQSFIPLFLNFSNTCSDNDWICLEEVPLAIII